MVCINHRKISFWPQPGLAQRGGFSQCPPPLLKVLFHLLAIIKSSSLCLEFCLHALSFNHLSLYCPISLASVLSLGYQNLSIFVSGTKWSKSKFRTNSEWHFATSAMWFLICADMTQKLSKQMLNYSIYSGWVFSILKNWDYWAWDPLSFRKKFPPVIPGVALSIFEMKLDYNCGILYRVTPV